MSNVIYGYFERSAPESTRRAAEVRISVRRRQAEDSSRVDEIADLHCVDLDRRFSTVRRLHELRSIELDAYEVIRATKSGHGVEHLSQIMQGVAQDLKTLDLSKHNIVLEYNDNEWWLVAEPKTIAARQELAGAAPQRPRTLWDALVAVLAS